jgi:hypothetical protein
MLQAIFQVMLQGAWPVGYSLKVLKGVVSARYCACGPFCSWVLVPGVLIPGVLAPTVPALGRCGSWEP